MGIKSFTKNLTVTVSKNNIAWAILKPFALFGFYVVNNRLRVQQLTNQEDDPLMSVFEKKQVLNGPFQGMEYPSSSSVGSAFYPKLIGSYERELHPVIEEFLKKKYTELLDIGCAEGYYAVGMGMRLKSTTVYAYDTNDIARKLCGEMAELNGIGNSVVIKESCTANDLADFNFTGKALIICDCEGYEAELFNKQNINNLRNCDLLIETHDFLNLSISGDLVTLFSETHTIQVIKSIDDIEKAQTYIYKEIDGLTLQEKFDLYREWRPSIMSWLICTPKQTMLSAK